MTNRRRNGKRSVRSRAPVALFAGRLGLEAAAHSFTAPLALEVQHPAPVGNLELDMTAADKTVDRRRPVAGLVNHQFAMEESVGLRAQANLHRHVVLAGQPVDP